MYAVAVSKDSSGNYHHRLHALDLTTGAEQFGGPVEIQATYPGSGVEGSGTTLTFDKGTDPKYIELQIRDETRGQQPEFRVKEW